MLAGVLRHAPGILRAVLHLLTPPQGEETVIVSDFWENRWTPSRGPLLCYCILKAGFHLVYEEVNIEGRRGC